MKKQSNPQSRFILEELEVRQLFSGGAEGLIDTTLIDTQVTYQELDEQNIQDSEVAATDSEADSRRHEIVFIDAGIEDYQALVDELLNQDDPSRNIEVIVLEQDRDGIEQISEVLDGRDDLDAIHILSHGDVGAIQLGNTELNNETLAENQLAISLWANAFTDNGDILIYGCNLAANEDGQNLVETIGELTLADVAASDDLTGNSAQGGDWLLEFRTGSIETGIALSEAAQEDFQQVLATYTVTSLADSGTGTLREAITLANANGGEDLIDFDIAGTINLTSGLPAIDDQVTIDATTAPGYTDTPVVFINGASAGATDGLDINSGGSGSTIKGLGFYNFNTANYDTVFFNGASNVTFRSNSIGLDASGNVVGGDNGIILYGNSSNNLIGGTGAGEGNVIAGTNYYGVLVASSTATGNAILGNNIYDNGSLAIDLGANGVTANDAGDADAGANELQNAPVISAAGTDGSSVAIAGSMNSTAYTTIRIEFFANNSGDASGHGEGETYLGSTTVFANGDGNATYVATFDRAITAGYQISATATVMNADGSYGSTSEFALNVTADSAIIVDTTEDVINGGDGLTSLREAIIAANSTGGHQTIFLPAGTYNLSIVGYNEDASASGDLDITDDLTLIGADATSTIINGDGSDRVLDITGSGFTAFISGVTITGGGGYFGGGGILVGANTTLSLSDSIISGNNMPGIDGGGIRNEGTAYLNNVRITGNSTTSSGGGIYNLGPLTIINSTIDNNNATGGDGGGIWNDGSWAYLTLVNTTVSGNSASGNGGGLYNAENAELINVTVTQNTAVKGGGVYEGTGTVTTSLLNTIVAGNTATSSNPDFDGSVTTQGNNIFGSNQGLNGFDTGLGDQVNVDPLLGALADNGGPVPTHALLTGSVAINAGSATGAPAVDQRDYTRDGTVDIGAFEYNGIAPPSNTAPEISSNGGGASAAVDVAENSTTVTTVTAYDVDGDTVTYSITGGADAAKFTIDSSTGALSFMTAPDYENPTDTGGDNLYDVQVMVSDGNGGTDTQDIAVTVTSVDTPSDITFISSNTADVTVLDMDGSGPVALTELSGLELDNRTVFTVEMTVDFDTIAASGWGGNLVSQNDGWDQNGFFFYVDNSALVYNQFSGGTWQGGTGSSAGSLTTGEHMMAVVLNNGTVTIYLDGTPVASTSVPSPMVDSSGSLQFLEGIDGHVSEIRIWSTARSQSEIQNNLSADLTGSESGLLALYTFQDGAGTTVTDATSNGYDLTVDETSTSWVVVGNTLLAGDVVGTVEATDPDAGDSITYSLVADAGSTFTINPATGELTWAITPDTSTEHTYNIRVRATDGASQIYEEDLVIKTGTSGSNSITGSDSDDLIIGLDSADTQTGGAGDDYLDGGFGDDAAVFSGNRADYSITYYDATDELVIGDTRTGSPDGTDTLVNIEDLQFADQTITITDPSAQFNDAPTITSNGGGNAASTNAAENETFVTTVTATDVDGDTITYSLSGGADSDWFSIDPNSGELTFNSAPDFENATDADTNGVYEVEIMADDGNGGTYTQLISVTVTNVDAVAAADNYTVYANSMLDVDWWDSDWTRRQQLTFDNLAQSETLTDFPVLIVLNSGNIDYSQTNDDGSDLRFFTADGTPLDYEIEQWNETGDSSVWVRIPQISANSNSDSVWMYYGNAAAESVENAAAVWDDNFVGVWHLNEDQAGTGTSGVYQDSTSNSNDGTDHIAATGEDGQITDGQQLEASDWIEIDHDDSLNLTGSMTLSFWINPSSDSGTFNRVIEKGLWGYNTSYYFGGGDGTNDLTFYLNGLEVIDTADNVLTVGEWQQATLSYTDNGDGTGTARLYLNGVEIATGSYTGGAVAGNTGRLAFGHDDPLYDFDGYIDEVQISHIDRSADWIAAQYQATKNLFGSEFVQFGTVETAPATAGVLANDSQDGNAHIAISAIDTTSTQGLVTIKPDGTFTYDPNGQFDYLVAGATATDSFSYDFTDSNSSTDTATVTITVTGVNDAPVAVADSFTVDEGSTTTLNLAGNDTDADDGLDLSSIAIVSGPANGSILVKADGTVDYTHDGSETLSDSFTYTIDDLAGATSNTVTVDLTVTPVNDAPVISSPSGTYPYTEGDGTMILGGSTTVNDSDSASFDGGQAVYQLTANATANDRLDIATAGSISVSGAEIYYGATLIGSYNGPVTGSDALVITFNASADVAAVQATMQNFSYENTSENPDTSTRTVEAYLTDGDGGTSNTLTGFISITAINDAPVLDSASLTVSEGQTVTLTGANFGITDPDSSSFTFNLSSISGGQFELTTASGSAITSFTSAQLAANQVVFVDDGNELAPSFDVTVNDGTADSNTLSASITYTPANDPPVLDSASLTVSEGQTVTLTNANFGITDPDSSSFTFNLSSISGGQFELTTASGSAITSFTSAQLAANQVVFVDDGNELAPSFDVTVNDGTADSNTLSASITYTPANDAPVITSSATMNVAENQTAVATVNAIDADGDTPIFTISGGADSTLFSIDTNTGVLSFNAAQDYETYSDADLDGIYEVQVTTSDGNGGTDVQNISVEITDVSTSITAGQSFGVSETAANGAAVGTVATTGDTPTGFSLTGGNSGNAFAIDAAGNITVNDASAIDYETGTTFTLTVQVDDGTTTTSETVTIDIIGINEVPTLISQNDSSVEENTDTSNVCSVETHDSTYEDSGDTATYSAFGGAEAGVFNTGGVSSDEQIIEEPSLLSSQKENELVGGSDLTGISHIDTLIDDLLSPDEAEIPEPSRFGNTKTDPTRSESSAAKPQKQLSLMELKQLQAYQDQISNLSLLSENEDAELDIQTETALWERMDEMHRQMKDDLSEKAEDKIEVQLLLGSSVGLTVGFVSWILRAGALVSGMLSSLPVLYRFDPLPILKKYTDKKLNVAASGKKENEHDETSQKIDDLFTDSGTTIKKSQDGNTEI